MTQIGHVSAGLLLLGVMAREVLYATQLRFIRSGEVRHNSYRSGCILSCEDALTIVELFAYAPRCVKGGDRAWRV